MARGSGPRRYAVRAIMAGHAATAPVVTADGHERSTGRPLPGERPVQRRALPVRPRAELRVGRVHRQAPPRPARPRRRGPHGPGRPSGGTGGRRLRHSAPGRARGGPWLRRPRRTAARTRARPPCCWPATRTPIRRLLARYDGWPQPPALRPARGVLTHGEPHPGNTMLTAAGWLLIDWDTALVAPPERDLWSLDPGDGSILSAYADATGVRPLPRCIELLPHPVGPDRYRRRREPLPPAAPGQPR